MPEPLHFELGPLIIITIMSSNSIVVLCCYVVYIEGRFVEWTWIVGGSGRSRGGETESRTVSVDLLFSLYMSLFHEKIDSEK